MSMPSPADLTSWTVTGQNEYTQVTPGGGPVAGMRVFYTTAKGHSSSIFVPQAQYNPVTVRALISRAAANLDEIGSLSGGAGTP